MKALCLAKEKDFNSKVTAMALNALTKVGHAHLDDIVLDRSSKIENLQFSRYCHDFECSHYIFKSILIKTS